LASRIAVTSCRRPVDYDAAVRKAGGTPWVPVIDVDWPEDVLGQVDGLLLTGGDDIDPAFFGAEPHPSYEPAEPGRDAYELALTRRALASQVPVLAICRGLQVLNVATGGTLIQDIPSQYQGALNHAGQAGAAMAHPVAVTPGSRLDAMLHPYAAGGPVMVNSRHHQAVEVLGEGLVVTATAPDGIIEGIEATGAAFCVGVQWHPESFVRSHEFDAIFAAFIAACRSERRPRSKG
jgi:putative glutamine amidotransferase